MSELSDRIFAMKLRNVARVSRLVLLAGCCVGLLVIIGIVAARAHTDTQFSVSESGKWKPVQTPSPGPITINPKFLITADQARGALLAARLEGLRHRRLAIGEEHSLPVITQDSLARTVRFTLNIQFLSPLDQARLFGNEAGLHAGAPPRTPRDTSRDFDGTIKEIVANSNKATFAVRMVPLPDPDLVLPNISFSLLDRNGNEISTSDRFAFTARGLFEVTELVAAGEALTFPITDNSGPLITNQMDKMTLVIRIDQQTQNLQYRLTPPQPLPRQRSRQRSGQRSTQR